MRGDPKSKDLDVLHQQVSRQWFCGVQVQHQKEIHDAMYIGMCWIQLFEMICDLQPLSEKTWEDNFMWTSGWLKASNFQLLEPLPACHHLEFLWRAASGRCMSAISVLTASTSRPVRASKKKHTKQHLDWTHKITQKAVVSQTFFVRWENFIILASQPAPRPYPVRLPKGKQRLIRPYFCGG